MSAIRIHTGQGDSPPPSPDDEDILPGTNRAPIGSAGDGQWRPLSSISRQALTTDTSEPENPDGEPRAEPSLRNRSRVSIAPEFCSADGAGSRRAPHELVPRDPPPSRAASTASHHTSARSRKRPRLRTAPGKLDRTPAEPHRAFATMDDRSRVTFDGIRGNARTAVNEFGDRVCRPYSVYTVAQQCERLAISPFGGPLMNSAAGRYRERYLAKHRPEVAQGTPSRESVKIKFQRFYDNLDLLAINVMRTPYGTLRRPPPKQARKTEEKTKSVPTELHKYTNERVNNLHKSMEKQKEGERRGPGVFSVEYSVAMEVSSNLEKHRKSRPSNLPGLPHFIAGRADPPRLQSQTETLLTPGELSLKEGITTNLYDQERAKRGPVKSVERPPRRARSPPLSKLSRDKFLPEAQQRRREQDRWLELRIGRPSTPPASEYTAFQSSSFATTVRPLTAMTNHNSCSESARRKSAKPEQSDEPTESKEQEVADADAERDTDADADAIQAEEDGRASDTQDKEKLNDARTEKGICESIEENASKEGINVPSAMSRETEEPDSNDTQKQMPDVSSELANPHTEDEPEDVSPDVEGAQEIANQNTEGGPEGTAVNNSDVEGAIQTANQSGKEELDVANAESEVEIASVEGLRETAESDTDCQQETTGSNSEEALGTANSDNEGVFEVANPDVEGASSKVEGQHNLTTDIP